MFNITNFDLNLLRVFDSLLRERSVTGAANRLGLSQPTVSNALTRMRNLAGDRLFVRTSEGMEPTPYARQIAEPIQHGLALIESGLKSVSTFDPATSDRLFTLLMTELGEAHFLPALLQRLGEQAPGVRIRTVQVVPEECAHLLETGTADLAIGAVPTLKRGYYQRVLFPVPFVVLFRVGHSLLDKGRDEITLQQYLGALHIDIRPPNMSNNPVDEALARAGHTRRTMVHLPHFVAVPRIVSETDLVASVPAAVLLFFGEHAYVRQAPLPFTIEEMHTRMLWHAREHQDPGNRWLRNLLGSLFNELRFPLRAQPRSVATENSRHSERPASC